MEKQLVKPAEDALTKLTDNIRLNRLAKAGPQKILGRIMLEIERKFHHGRGRNLEMLVELLAKWLVLHEELPLANCGCKAFEGLSLEKTKIYKDMVPLLGSYVAAARKDPWDHLGELRQELNLVGPGQNMTPKGVVDMMIQMTFMEQSKKECKYTFAKCKPPSRKQCWFCEHSPNPWPLTQLDT